METALRTCSSFLKFRSFRLLDGVMGVVLLDGRFGGGEDGGAGGAGGGAPNDDDEIAVGE